MVFGMFDLRLVSPIESLIQFLDETARPFGLFWITGRLN